MQAIIKPGFLQGTIAVPPSKSIMQRACAGALLHKGKTIINNTGKSEDDKAALEIIQGLGAKIIEQSETRIIIESPGIIQEATSIHCGESGLSARLFTPIAALSENEIRIEGKGSLLKRPMDFFNTVLPKLNVSLPHFNGHIPFTVSGKLKPRNIVIDGNISSQFLSGLLFSFCYAATAPVIITVKDLNSKPYIDLTLQTLSQFGWHVSHENYERFFIDPSNFESKTDVEITVEGDWSSASYWLVGAAINGKIICDQLSLNSLQADKKIVAILEDAGGIFTFKESEIFIEKNSLQAFQTDLTDSPDLFPIVSVLASMCKGTSSLKGLHRLKHKESDREKSIMEMLQQFGVDFKTENDSLIIEGKQKLHATTINGYNDHRIVMAAAIGALVADGETIVTDAKAVAKSYPDFFEALKHLKAN
ncbi:MAG TPA: 3-phosphoshikimate 1-carboxyvinyltransferase [Flavipsychrobacter sp.]|nr:3-phosphoshikimate 1-carboxyvinyltransferase [Flavipsychrobacter sp.]